jgi:origin recognition complex subunit 2
MESTITLDQFRSFSKNYFSLDASLKPSKKNKFSKLVKNKTACPQDLSASLAQSREKLFAFFRSQFDLFRNELEFGYSLLFYGIGSKLGVLEEFCLEKLPDCPIIIVDAFTNKFSPEAFARQFLKHLTEAPLDQDLPVEALYSQICSSLGVKIVLLFCGIENVSLETLNLISFLAENENILFITMSENLDFQSSLSPILLKRFKFVFHDLTTFVPYNFEFGALNSVLPETRDNSSNLKKLEGAKFVWASLPTKSQKLYKLIVEYLSAGSKKLTLGDLAKLALAQFLIPNEQVLRPMLGEFIDHELLAVEEADDSLSVPFTGEELQSFVQ